MTSAEAGSRQVERSPAVVLGPALLRGATPVHVIKDRTTGRRYEIGAREYFVLSRLDGRRSLDEIGEEYAKTFNRRLGDAAWGQLLGLLAGRNLLAGAAGSPVEDRPPPNRKRVEVLGPMHGRYVLGDPSAFIARVYRPAAWLFRPAVLVPLLVALAGMDVWVALRLPVLAAGVPTLYAQPPLTMLGAVVLWTGAAVHEFGHGLTCRHYGGDASAVGVRWYGPLFAAFCSAEDVHLFHTRRARIATAAAGVVAGQAFLLPFFALWLLVPMDRVTHDALGAVVLIGVGQSLVSYLPVPPLDGYAMLAHALNVSHLAPESRRYLWLRVRSALRGTPVPVDYPDRVRPVYLGYGLALVVGAVALSVLLAVWAYRWPPARYLVVAVAAAALYSLARRHLAARKQQKGRLA